jgi:flagellar biosynthesis protein FlhA
MDSVQKTETGSFINLEPGIINSIINNLSKQIQKLMNLGQQPIIIASPIVRLYFKRLVDQSIPGLVVLSYNELDPDIQVQAVGTVSI